MGFYRTGKLWSIEHFDVKPDIITMSKALTNGMNPLSCLWAREDIIGPHVFTVGTAYSTFSANPLGTAAGLAVMEVFQGWENLEAEIAQKGASFLNKLRMLRERFPRIVANVDGLSLALHLEICEDDGWAPSAARADALFREGLKGDLTHDGTRVGLVLKTGGIYRNIITLSSSLPITDYEIDVAIDLLAQLLGRVDSSKPAR